MQRAVRCEDDSSTDCIELTVKYLLGVFSFEVQLSGPHAVTYAAHVRPLCYVTPRRTIRLCCCDDCENVQVL